jgi:plasmid stabilization system protein ParE
MRVIWSRPALRQLDAIRAFIAEDKPGAAARVAATILAAAERLEVFPNLGRKGRSSGSRELIVPGLPYIVVYRIANDGIEIASVMHTSRMWPEVL